MRDLKEIISANEEAYRLLKSHMAIMAENDRKDRLAKKQAEEMILREISKNR